MSYPKPQWLHDARHIGRDRRERETRQRRAKTFAGKVTRADSYDLQVMAYELETELLRRGDVFAAEYGGAAGIVAENVGGVLPSCSRRVNGRQSIESPLVLSLFPGIGLLDRAFREEGYCIVAGPDKIVGQDVAEFVGTQGKFDGVIGGPPCQDFSALNRTKNGRPRHEILDSYGADMLRHYLRIVAECSPEWFLLENVPGVPDVQLGGYQVQRLGVTDLECGGVQRRNRHFQFGHKLGWLLRPERVTELPAIDPEPAALASDGKRGKQSYAEHCRLQGLDAPIELPGWSRTAKFTAVGNGVPLTMGRVLARAVTAAGPRDAAADCVCGCGRRITPPARHATASCRKVMQRRREGERPIVRM